MVEEDNAKPPIKEILKPFFIIMIASVLSLENYKNILLSFNVISTYPAILIFLECI